MVDAAGSLGKTADFINLAKRIGKHMAVTAVYRDHPGRGGDFCLAEAAAEKFPLAAAIGLFSAFPHNPAIKVKLPGPPEKQTGIKTEPLQKNNMSREMRGTAEGAVTKLKNWPGYFVTAPKFSAESSLHSPP